MAPWWLQIGHKSEKCNDVIVWWHDVIVKFIWRCRVSLVKFSHWSKFHVNIMTRSGVMTIFDYWPEIRKSEIPLSEICTISGDWDKLGIPNLAQMFLIKRLLNVQNATVTAFTVSELSRENNKGVKFTPPILGLRCKWLRPPRKFNLCRYIHVNCNWLNIQEKDSFNLIIIVSTLWFWYLPSTRHVKKYIFFNHFLPMFYFRWSQLTEWRWRDVLGAHVG